MRVAVCYNQTPENVRRGEARDMIADAGAATEAAAVLKAVQLLGHQAEMLPLGDSLGAFVQRIGQYAPDMVFNLCEGFWGDAHQEMNLAGLFELLGLPFTGSSALTLGLTQNKSYTKALLQQKGLPTPAWCLVQQGEKLPDISELQFPLIVKPACEDASQGIGPASVVDSEAALRQRLAYVLKTYQQPALIEEFIAGRELNVTVLGGEKLRALPLAEIVFDSGLERPMVCFDSKWRPDSPAFKGTRPVCPANLGARERLLVNLVSMRAARLLGCRDYARVDIRLRDSTPYILEVNANPDISPDAGVARAAAAEGLTYPQLIERILLDVSRRRKAVNANT